MNNYFVLLLYILIKKSIMKYWKFGLAIFLSLVLFSEVSSAQQQLVTKYWSNGNLRQKGYLKNGLKNGEWRFYYDDGRDFMVINFKDGLENGIFKKFDYRCNCLQKQGIYKNGLAEGEWEYFDKNGYLTRKEFYKNGKLLY